MTRKAPRSDILVERKFTPQTLTVAKGRGLDGLERLKVRSVALSGAEVSEVRSLKIRGQRRNMLDKILMSIKASILNNK